MRNIYKYQFLLTLALCVVSCDIKNDIVDTRGVFSFHWKSGKFLHFKLGKVEKTINPKASWQHSLRPIYMVMFLEKTIIAPTYYKVDLSGIG